MDITNFVDGRSVPPARGEWLDVHEPATGAVYARVADSSEEDVERAVAAARRAFPAWSRTPAEERARLLWALADRVERDLERFARAESIDTGKPIGLARSLDIPRAVKNLRFFAGAVAHFASESHATDDLAINYTLRRPRGPAACISPWNLPLYLFTWKIAPALATGNTVVGKPSELTPVTASMLAEAAAEVGFPPGVLNVVHGRGARAGEALVAHPDVPAITFTGGTVTGARIARTAGPLFKKISLELGGKNPNVVFADADLDEAIPTSVRSSFANQGQVCLCGSRILVEAPIYEAFVERLVTLADRLVAGDPLEEGTEQGALVSAAQFEKVRSYVALARAEGGRIECGGGPPADLPPRCRGGWFHRPTVITGLAPESRVNQEEIFGPVVTVLPFRTEAEVLERANGVAYGLSASVWTQNLSRAHRLADRLETGTVWVNCWMLRDLRVPFGGTKQSGVGREGGLEALRFFTEPKNVCIRYPSEPRP